MNKTVVAIAASFLSVTAYASGPGGDPGATGSFSEYLSASEVSDDWATYVYMYRSEYSDGHGYGHVRGQVDNNYFSCQLDGDADLIDMDGNAEHAVIEIDQDDTLWCWSSDLPAPITFDCTASGYWTSRGVSNQETSYHDGYEYKAHTNFFANALDCVAFIGNDIVLDSRTGVVWDGEARVNKYIAPNLEREE